MNILGLYGAFDWDANKWWIPDRYNLPAQLHDSGVTVFKDGNHICSILEERLTRIKYDGNFPINSIKYCLEYSKLNESDIDVVCIPTQALQIFYEQLELNIVQDMIYDIFPNAKISIISHHLSHAAGSIVSSGYDDGSIVVLDGAGSLALNKDTLLIQKECNSIGYFNKKDKLLKLFVGYTGFNQFGHWYNYNSVPLYWEKTNKNTEEERDKIHPESIDGKIMGLCAYGNATKLEYVKSAEHWGGVPYILFSKEDIIGETVDDKAATLQRTFESAMLDYMTMLKQRDYVYDNVCFSGGSFMNVLANSVIKNSKLFDNMHMYPFPSDAGQSFGAASYAAFMLESDIKLPKNLALLGKEYTEDEIKTALDSFDIKYERYEYEELYTETAHLIDGDNIIGWFQGRSEAGARALGSRSILMSARNPDNKDILNSRVKHREYWRPFAGIILEECLNDYFENAFVSPYMMYSMTVAEDKRNVIPAITHVDNSCRIQTVTEEYNFHITKMIQEYNKITGIPVVLNTSFNDNGEPIVETPEHAIEAFLNMDIDYLVIGNYIVNKKDIK
ncbi:COG2192 Predicted carbamoyl transferase, NodU family [uncultured Caudovirales phage]|uniref:COG2192 Predicted carbamoyl transferase, NodU family n=1 Tax=uncultured Caudovirales phage TaxID=2100421 RepID=A0A6J7WZ12_9CAUD|nr:COG2192 Predicted carbamoyl transferase, NodU family [uncultured Caudovirales phage]